MAALSNPVTRTYQAMWAVRRNTRVIGGTFFPAGTGTVTFPSLGTTTGIMGVKSIVWTSTGLFTITLDKQYKSLLYAPDPGIAMASATDLNAQWGAIDVASAATLQLRTLTAGSVTDIAANAGNYVMFALFLADTDAI